MTNYEALTQMPPKQFAENLSPMIRIGIRCGKERCDMFNYKCEDCKADCFLKWLNSEVIWEENEQND